MAEVKVYRVKRDGEKDLKFSGELIAEASDHSHQGSRQNRWTEMRLYKTTSGKFVLVEEHITCWQGESNTITALVLESEEAVVDAIEMGHEEMGFEEGGRISDVAKELLEDAGIEFVEEV